MKLLEITIKAIMVFCASAGAFCVGYAVRTGETHVFVMAAFYGILALLIRHGIVCDRKREEEDTKNKFGRD